MRTFEVDALLETMVLEGKSHFAPHYICKRLGYEPKEIDEVLRYLISLVPSKLSIIYEVMCPFGHSDYQVKSLEEINFDEQECGYCGVEYVPDLNNIWIAFNFNSEYADFIKKKRQKRHLKNHPNRPMKKITPILR